MGECLTIRTGLQGNGKTLNTIKEVDIQAKKEDRVVYYHNVTDLDPSKLQASWYEFDDPTKWFELPNDSIIVIDEAQGDPSEGKNWFGSLDPRTPIPAHISRFATMRKQGHEVHLITQDPRMLHVHARRLCNSHIHYWRIMSSSKVSRYQMPRVKDDVEKLSNFKDASRTTVTLDKRYFDVYSSAQAKHHFKFKPSSKAIFFLFASLVSVVLFYRAYAMVFGGAETTSLSGTDPASAPADSGAVGQAVAAAKSLLPGIAPGVAQDKPKTVAEYVASRTPRIADDPASAPIYDDLTKPQTYPRLSCVSSKDQELLQRAAHRMQVRNLGGKLLGCQCYTQQGSKYQTSFAYCLNVVKNGYFDHARPDPGSLASQERSTPAPSATAPAASTAPVFAQHVPLSFSAPGASSLPPAAPTVAQYVPSLLPDPAASSLGAPSSADASSASVSGVVRGRF